jgi:D-sedoheptulose 7-phosphate isomerase
MNKSILNTNKYLEKLAQQILKADLAQIENAIEVIRKTWMSGGQVITMGNGGSSLTALHFINDWNKSIYLETGRQFRGRSLVDNIGLIMSYANDVSFLDIFYEQLKNILHPGDLVIGISGSGNSENVIRAIDFANKNGAVTLGLSGFDGGRLKQCAQHNYWVDICDMQVVEDMHMAFGHSVMQRLCGYE